MRHRYFTNSPRAMHRMRPVLPVRGHSTDVRGRSAFPAGITSVRHQGPDAAGRTFESCSSFDLGVFFYAADRAK